MASTGLFGLCIWMITALRRQLLRSFAYCLSLRTSVPEIDDDAPHTNLLAHTEGSSSLERIKVIKLPSNVSLTSYIPPQEVTSSAFRISAAPTTATTELSHLQALPVELQWNIINQLSAIDRLCLALTCKVLAKLTIGCCGQHYSIREVVYRTDLLPRLARGWIDQHKYRYCGQCQRILPMDFDFFRHRLEEFPSPETRHQDPIAICYDGALRRWCESDNPGSQKCTVRDILLYRSCCARIRECPSCFYHRLRSSGMGLGRVYILLRWSYHKLARATPYIVATINFLVRTLCFICLVSVLGIEACHKWSQEARSSANTWK